MPAKKTKKAEVKITSTTITTSYGRDYKTGEKGLNNIHICKEFEGDADVEEVTKSFVEESEKMLEEHGFKAVEDEDDEEDDGDDEEDEDDDDEDDEDDDDEDEDDDDDDEDEDEDEDEEEEKDYDDMEPKELRALCKERKIKKTSKGKDLKTAKKPQLIVTLEKYDIDN